MPLSTDLDRVRLLVGDTNADDPILSDEEVETFIADRTLVDADTGDTVSINLPGAAADAAGAIAGKYAREFDFGEDGQNFRRAQRVGHYLSLERELRNRSGAIAVPMSSTDT